ncbi:MAG: sulfite exporter TauE/SafE family protein [Steroidobacteraceae bacterium]
MHLSLLQYLIGTACGAVVGFSLGLVGGGGSILAVPLIVYAVGVKDPHLAIGTSALAVAVNAGLNLFAHARGGTVKWRIAGVFAPAGVVGAWLGSLGGKALDGQKLLALFAILMFLVGAWVLRSRSAAHAAVTPLDGRKLLRLLMAGGLTGVVCGFFGIGGGFLIVPGLMQAACLPILQAVGSSLVAVTAFGLTTALNYARSGWVDWPLAAVLIGGGALGGLAGAHLARHLAARKGVLNRVFAVLVFGVAAYMLYRSAATPGLWW